jgi:hypothetical protein
MVISAEPSQTFASRFGNQKQTNVGERIELLKYNLNKDYFDDENESKTFRNNIPK